MLPDTPESAGSFGDWFAQSMMIEHSGGNESDTATQTQTTKTPVDFSIPMGDSAISGFADLAGASAGAIADNINKEETATADPDCPDGDCAPAK